METASVSHPLETTTTSQTAAAEAAGAAAAQNNDCSESYGIKGAPPGGAGPGRGGGARLWSKTPGPYI